VSRPSIRDKVTWADIDRRILDIVMAGLALLKKRSRAPDKVTNEDVLSRELYEHLLKADRMLQARSSKYIVIGLPIFQANCQPHSSDTHHVPREDKVPDFQWNMRSMGIVIDRRKPGWDRYAVHYHVECKRLGRSNTSWILNNNYIEHGVRRFIDRNHGYGKGVETGAMVGYVQNMELDDILMEVNAKADELAVPHLVLSSDSWAIGQVNRLDQVLNRPDVLPTPFSLRHIWVDLRSVQRS